METVRVEGSTGINTRSNRWPTLATTSISNSRSTPADEKSRRTQVFKRLRNFSTISFILIYNRYSEVFMVVQVGFI
jgi:hypothetical protein